ncbi:hypothetical protein BVC93_25020 [Mycobacterium sp. MS1601]|nr:hypothetical protein BVC93_25020 [Mycobacterium sp. MS1601]
MTTPHDADDMAMCPNGHVNPADWDVCGECGESLEPTRGLLGWLHSPAFWVALVASAVALVGAGVLLGHSASGPGQHVDDAAAKRAAVQQWWTSARSDVDELESALDDSQRAVRQWDSSAFNDACQRMHDAAAVGVPQHLPTPDPQISAELDAAAEDAHSASHMCLAALAQTRNNYDGEFIAATEQAETHVKEAKALIDLGLTA